MGGISFFLVFSFVVFRIMWQDWYGEVRSLDGSYGYLGFFWWFDVRFLVFVEFGFSEGVLLERDFGLDKFLNQVELSFGWSCWFQGVMGVVYRDFIRYIEMLGFFRV